MMLFFFAILAISQYHLGFAQEFPDSGEANPEGMPSPNAPDFRRYKACHPELSGPGTLGMSSNESSIFGCFMMMHDYMMAKGIMPGVVDIKDDLSEQAPPGPIINLNMEDMEKQVQEAEMTACKDLKQLMRDLPFCCDTQCYCEELAQETGPATSCKGQYDYFPIETQIQEQKN